VHLPACEWLKEWQSISPVDLMRPWSQEPAIVDAEELRMDGHAAEL